MLDCESGGTRTDISGQLNFLRGPGPHERECEWTIESPDDSSNVIVTGFLNSDDCGYGFIKFSYTAYSALSVYTCGS